MVTDDVHSECALMVREEPIALLMSTFEAAMAPEASVAMTCAWLQMYVQHFGGFGDSSPRGQRGSHHRRRR